MTDGPGDGGRFRSESSPLSRRTLAAIALAGLAAVAVLLVHETVFPHLSDNHDEAVYLQQAALLSDGRLQMRVGGLADAVRPWFFVQDGGRLYPKYAPVAAGIFALAKLLTGSYVPALPAIAFAAVLLAVLVVEAAFDRRTGLVAGTLLAASPLFLLTAATFLSYAPTTALNLAFALGYVRAVRRRSRGWAALAGVAVGLAFFSRPYTAVLFAAPFVVHALATLVAGARTARRQGWTPSPDRPLATLPGPLREAAVRNAVIAALGLAFVGVTLTYNWRLTGDPLLFPYQAFAPVDGVGFGHRRILVHERNYTLPVALAANGRVLRALLTRWFVAPPLGALLAGAGVARALRRQVRSRLAGAAGEHPSALPNRLPAPTLRLVLLGVGVSVVVGNVAFWGNLNVLGNPDVRGDGLIALLGPFYHVDLLVVLAAFAAHALVAGWDALAPAVRERSGRPAAALAVAVLLVAAPLAAADAAALERPVERNLQNTERYERVYAPFEDRTFDRALVFVPTPFGDWLNHPFQSLRNDPDLDGPVVYALDRGPAGDHAVLAAFPDRRPYRFTYRGRWRTGRPVVPTLRRLRVVEGERLDVRTTVAVPDGASLSSVRLTADGESVVLRPGAVADGAASGDVTVEWSVAAGSARLTALGDERLAGRTVPLAGATEVALAVTVVQPGGATLTYRQELSAAVEDGRVRAVWPPESRVCRLTTDCGLEGTYLPDHPEEHVDGVSMESRVETSGGDRTGS